MKTLPSFASAFVNSDLTSSGVVGSEPSATPISIAAATTPGGPGERQQGSRLDEDAFLKAVPGKGENLSGRAIHLGALAHKDFKAGKNPAGWAVDEDTWDRAKEAASKSYDMADDAFWPVVATIYEKMGGTIGEANVSLESALVAASNDANPTEMSSSDKSEALASAVRDRLGFTTLAPSCQCDPWICDLYEDACVYQIGSKYFRIGYRIDGTKMTLIGDPVAVTRTTEYTPMSAQ